MKLVDTHCHLTFEPMSDRLRPVLDRDKVVAMGEIGLDYKIPRYDRHRQMEVLRTQLDVAVERGLPVILHCRGAFDDLLDVLASYNGDVKGILHAFSRGPQLAQRFIDQGLSLGFGGAITRPGAIRCQKSAEVVPLAHIVLETDAPS